MSSRILSDFSMKKTGIRENNFFEIIVMLSDLVVKFLQNYA